MIRKTIIEADDRHIPDADILVFENEQSSLSEARANRIWICPMIVIAKNGKYAVTGP